MKRLSVRVANMVLLVVIMQFLSLETMSQSKPEPFKFGKMELEFLEQSKALDKHFENNGYLYKDEAKAAYVERLGQSLLGPDSNIENVEWKFRIFRDADVNAFALPHGSIYLNTGLISRMESEEQLIGVLAHEIMHIRNRHSYKSYRNYRKKTFTVNILSYGLSWVDPALGWAVGMGGQFLTFLTVMGYSRELETEADLGGAQLLIEKSYHPNAMVESMTALLNRYEVDLYGEPFYSSHPKLKERIQYLSGWSAKNAPKKELSLDEVKQLKDRYQKTIASITLHNIDLSIDDGKYRSSVTLAKRLIELDASVENTTALANAYAALGPYHYEPTKEELSKQGKKDTKKRKNKFTLTEQEKTLLHTEEGKQVSKGNYEEAQKLYDRAKELNPSYPILWRSLGEFYERQIIFDKAAESYSEYLKILPSAKDHLMIKRRIEKLKQPDSESKSK